MKASPLQSVLAHGFELSTRGSALLCAGAAGWRVLPSLPDSPNYFWFIVLLICVLLLGWMLGGLFVWPFVAAFASRRNGAPFREGDPVRILRGPYRNRVLVIYAIWPGRHQVRVRLDEQQEKDATDVFGYHEVCRANPVQSESGK